MLEAVETLTMNGITLKQNGQVLDCSPTSREHALGLGCCRLVLLYWWLSQCDSNPAQYKKNCRFGHLVHALDWGVGGAMLPYLGLCLNASGHILSCRGNDKLQYYRQSRGSRQIDPSSLDRPSPLWGAGRQTIAHVCWTGRTSTAAGLGTWLSSHSQQSTKHTWNQSQDLESSADSKTGQERCWTLNSTFQNVIWWDEASACSHVFWKHEGERWKGKSM